MGRSLREIDEAYRASKLFQEEVGRRSQSITEREAVTLSRAYALNPNLNPELLVAAVAGGADEQLIQTMSAEVGRQQVLTGAVAESNTQISGDRAKKILETAKPILENPNLTPEQKIDALAGYNLTPDVVQRASQVEINDDGNWFGDAWDFAKDLVSENPVTNWLQDGADAVGIDELVELTQRHVSDPVRGASRTLMAVSQSIPQLAENTLRTSIPLPGFYGGDNAVDDNVREHGWVEGIGRTFLNAFQATDLGAAATQFVNDGRIDMGEGFFVGGTVAKQSGQLQRDVRGEIMGGSGRTLPWSIGLNVADSFVQQGMSRESWAFDAISGAIDAAVEIGVDPIGRGKQATKIFPGLEDVSSRALSKYSRYARLEKEARVAGDLVQAGRYRKQAYKAVGVRTNIFDAAVSELDDYEVALRGTLMDEAGMIEEGVRQDVIIPQFARFLSTGRGKRLVKTMVDETDAAEVLARHRFKIGPQAARRIADATTPQEVMEAYIRGMSPAADMANTVRMLPYVGVAPVDNMGSWMKRTLEPRTRWGNYIPSDGAKLDARDPLQMLSRLDSLYRLFPTGILDEAEKGRYATVLRKQRVNQAVDVLNNGNQQDLFNLFDDVAADFRQMFVKLGYDDRTAEAMTLLREDRSRLGQWSLRQLQNGDAVDDSFILFYNQLFNGAAEILNADQFQQVYRSMGRVKEFFRKNPLLSQYGRYNSEKSDLLERSAQLTDELGAVTDDAAREALRRELAVVEAKLQNVNGSIEGLARKNDDIVAISLINGTTDVLDYVFGAIWKPLALIRGAYVARVVPEEVGRVLMGGSFSGNRAGVDYIVTAAGKAFTTDARGVRWAGATTLADELDNALRDVADDLRVARAQGDSIKVDDLLTTQKRLQDELDEALDEMLDASDEFNKAMIGRDRARAVASLTRDVNQQVRSGGWGLASRTNGGEKSNWVKGVMERISFLSNDDVARVIARGGLGEKARYTIDGVTTTFGRHVAAGRLAPDADRVAVWLEFGSGRKYWDDIQQSYRESGRNLDINGWLAMQRDDIALLTGGRWADGVFEAVDEDLLRAIATGRFNGTKLQLIDKKTGRMFYPDEFRSKVDEFGAANPGAPERIHYEVAVTENGQRANILQRTAQVFFGSMYGVASDKLSRSPTFRRMYWKQMEYLLPNLSADEATKLLEQAVTANVNPNLLSRLRSAASLADGQGTIKQADEFAKAGALRYTQDLLFDASKRGSAMDQMRLLLPFGDAWKEVYSTWIKIMYDQRGMPAKHLLKGIAGGQDATLFGPGDIYGVDESGEIVTAPDGRREGMFWKRPGDGTWMATFPFSQELSKTFSGGAVEMGLDFPVENLNIAGSVVPGVGPAMAQTVNTLIPDDPNWDWLRQTLFPFGEPTDPASEAGKTNALQDQFVPGWLRRVSALLPEDSVWGDIRNMLNDTQSDPSYLSMRNWVYKSLASSGDYGADYGSQEQLRTDAQTIANRMYAMRGFAAFTGPAAPMTRFMIESKEGNVLGALLTDEWRNLEQSYLETGTDPDKAVFDILDMYGADLWMQTSSNTVSEIKGMGSSQIWFDEYRRNKKAVDTYKEVAGFFLADDGNFDAQVYFAQARQGLRRPSTPDEMYEQAAQTLAYSAYNRVRERLGPESERSLADRQFLAAFRRALETYFNIAMRGGKSQDDRRQQLAALESIVGDAQRGKEQALNLLSTNTGQYVMQYMAARSEAQRLSVEELGLTDASGWATSSAGRALRDEMRQLGQELSAQDYSFARLYRFVLAKEMQDDEPETVPTATQAAVGEMFPAGRVRR